MNPFPLIIIQNKLCRDILKWEIKISPLETEKTVFALV